MCLLSIQGGHATRWHDLDLELFAGSLSVDLVGTLLLLESGNMSMSTTIEGTTLMIARSKSKFTLNGSVPIYVLIR